MEIGGLGAYLLTVTAITAAPGPMLAILIVRALGSDVRGAVAFAVGLGIGDIAAALMVCAGLGAWATSAPGVLLAFRLGGAAYLIWVAAALWMAGEPRAPETAGPARGRLASTALAGFATCLGNPQTLLLYLTLLPSLILLDDLTAAELGGVLIATGAATLGVFAVVICFAQRARRVLASPGSARACNRTLAAVTALAAAWILAG